MGNISKQEKKDKLFQYSEDQEDSWQFVLDIHYQLPAPETVVYDQRIKLDFKLCQELNEPLKGHRLLNFA